MKILGEGYYIVDPVNNLQGNKIMYDDACKELERMKTTLKLDKQVLCCSLFCLIICFITMIFF